LKYDDNKVDELRETRALHSQRQETISKAEAKHEANKLLLKNLGEHDDNPDFSKISLLEAGERARQNPRATPDLVEKYATDGFTRRDFDAQVREAAIWVADRYLRSTEDGERKRHDGKFKSIDDFIHWAKGECTRVKGVIEKEKSKLEKGKIGLEDSKVEALQAEADLWAAKAERPELLEDGDELIITLKENGRPIKYKVQDLGRGRGPSLVAQEESVLVQIIKIDKGIRDSETYKAIQNAAKKETVRKRLEATNTQRALLKGRAESLAS